METKNLHLPLNLLSLLIFLSIICSCVSEKAAVGNKNYIIKNIEVKDFNSIKLIGSADVEYAQSKDGKTEVKIYGSKNLIDLIEISVSKETLNVKYKDNTQINKDKGDLKVYVTNPEVKSVTLEGSGDILLNGDLNAQELLIKLSGSGDIESNGKITSSTSFRIELNGSGDIALNSIASANGIVQLNGSGDVEVQKNASIQDLKVKLNGSGDLKVAGISSAYVNASLNGSGDVELNGSSKFTELSLSNSGSLKAAGLQSEEVNASLHGSGDITCNAINKLNAKVKGSGSIRYKGEPIVEDHSDKKDKVRKY